MKQGSLYLHLAGAFILILMLTTAISVGIEFAVTQRNLPEFFAGVRGEWVSSYLAAVYARDGSWDNVGGEIEYLFQLEALGPGEESLFRYVVRDREGITLYNSFEELLDVSSEPLLRADDLEIPDYRSGGTAGSVSVYLGAGYLERQTESYFVDLVQARLRQQLVTLALGIILVLFVSRRLAAPIKSLTLAIGLTEAGRATSVPPESGPAEIRELGRAFNRLIESLSRERQIRSRLVADLSHDINNPLHAMLLEARALQDGLSAPEEAAGGILASLSSLKNVVYDLEWLALVDAGEYRLVPETVNSLDFLESLELSWEARARRQGQSLSFHMDETFPGQFRAEPYRLARALGNLLDNAIGHNGPGSTIALKLGCSGSWLYFTVSDDGPPLPTGSLAIFSGGEGAGEGNTVSPGRGMGIALRIARLHGGDLSYTSLPQGGKEITLRLPADGTPSSRALSQS